MNASQIALFGGVYTLAWARIDFERDEIGDHRLSLKGTKNMREAIHPGEHLAEEMEERAIKAAELARRIGVPTNRVTGIMNGTRAITAKTAMLFADVFGTSAMFWMNLQSLYELRREEIGMKSNVPSSTKSFRLEPGKATKVKVSPSKTVAFRSDGKVVSKQRVKSARVRA